MYLISDMFSFTNKGLVFYHNGFVINYIILLIMSPIIIIIYIKNTLKLKNHYSNYFKVTIIYKNKVYYLNGFLDTGNHLKDIYKHRFIILANININYKLDDIIYTPYSTLNHNGILKCIKPDKVYINGIEFNNYLVGLSKEEFKIDGINCILHSNMKGKLK